MELCLDNYDFSNPQLNSGLVKFTLSSVSSEEINTFLKRVNFYIKHFSIIKKNTQDEVIEKKINFLKAVRSSFIEETKRREIPVAIEVQTRKRNSGTSNPLI